MSLNTTFYNYISAYHGSLLLKASLLQLAAIYILSYMIAVSKEKKNKKTSQQRKTIHLQSHVCKLQGQFRVEVMLFSFVAKVTKSFNLKKVPDFFLFVYTSALQDHETIKLQLYPVRTFSAGKFPKGTLHIQQLPYYCCVSRQRHSHYHEDCQRESVCVGVCAHVSG